MFNVLKKKIYKKALKRIGTTQKLFLTTEIFEECSDGKINKQ